MSIITRFETSLCSVCRRYATGAGYTPNHRKPILWVCDDPICLEIAIRTYSMSQDKFTQFERIAAEEGAMVAGPYLEQIGKTDIRELTRDEYFEFARRIIAGYRNHLQALCNEEVPF
jgi:hypothetical protein